MKPLFRPCPYCLPTIKAGLSFQNLLRQYEAVELHAKAFNTPQAAEMKINVNSFSVYCLKCKGTQQVLTKDGQEILDLIESLNGDKITARFGVHVAEEEPLTDEQGVPL